VLRQAQACGLLEPLLAGYEGDEVTFALLDRIDASTRSGVKVSEPLLLAALFLSRFASLVYLILRRDRLRATKVLQDRIHAHAKIEPVWDSVVAEVLGDHSGVTALAVTDPHGANRRTLAVAGLFVAIGVVPKAHFLAGVLELDAEGYILTDAECRTSMPGVFAAGDVRKKILKQIATAVGDGAVAAIVAEKYLDELG
jgi:thioredoxin reductase (NADPH)